MQPKYHTTTKDPKVRDVCQVAFPNYRGNKCQVIFTDRPVNLASYWDGGSRSYFKIVRLGDSRTLAVPAQHPAFDAQLKGAESFEIPPGFVVVEHVIFCGKDLGLRIYARPDGSALLPEPSQELSEIEAHVLIMTAGRKSSYAGIKDYRAAELKRRCGYTLDQVNAARESLRAKGYLNARNAITNDGRNAVASHPDRMRL